MIDFWLISTRRILSFSRLIPTTLQLTITITITLLLHRVETTLPTTPPIVMVLITITELHIVNVPPSTQTNILLVYPGATMPDILRYVATLIIFFGLFHAVYHLIFCFRLADAEAYFYLTFTKGN